MLNTFGTIKIDKITSLYVRSDICKKDRHDMDNRLRSYFPDLTASNKAGHIIYRFTPTKLVTSKREKLNHNLQMPSEKILSKVINNTTLFDLPIQNKVWCSEIHLAKDIILNNAVDDYLLMLKNSVNTNFEVKLIQSNKDGYSLSLYPSHNIDSEESIKFKIKFYDKAKEYYKKHGTYICQLHEPLSKEDVLKVGDAYDSKGMTLDLSQLNLMRIEVEFHRKDWLKYITKKLSNTEEQLTISLLIRALNSGMLYEKLEDVFNSMLKKYVFKKYCSEPVIEDVSDIRFLASKLLKESQDCYYYRAIANELWGMNQFSEIAKIMGGFNEDSQLYEELYNNLFDTKEKENKTEYISSSHLNTCKSSIFKYSYPSYLNLIYDVPVLDDS